MTTDEPPFSDSDSDSIVSFGTTYPEYPANAGQPLGLPYKHAPTPYTSEDNTFHTIGGNTLKAPFLDCKELKAHLCLLRAFKDLRATVEGSPTGTSKMNAWPELARQLDGPDRWTWFLGVAVDRFWNWVRARKSISGPFLSVQQLVRHELPPIDVLMVWHAYLLNPMWYAEDLLRIPNHWMLMGSDIFLELIVSVGDISTYEVPPSRQNSWYKQTGTFFDPFVPSMMTTHRIKCPHCLSNFSVPRLKDVAGGYSQAHFTVECTQCHTGGISKEHLGILKFAECAVLDPYNRDHFHEHGLGCYFAGTLHTTLERDDRKAADAAKNELRKALGFDDIDPRKKHEYGFFAKHIIEHSKWPLTPLAADHAHSSLRQSQIERVMSAYTDDMPSSINLVGAILHQCSFIDKMHDLGWTKPGYFDDETGEAVLTHAISRYHAFLDLLSSSPTSLFVPTLDIDLVWHTHQLRGPSYHKDCFTYFKRYIDHPDKIEGEKFISAFGDTCRVWQHRFNVPYTYCGCPLPKMSIWQRHKAKNHTSTPCELALVPPKKLNALAATHASEHNAGFTEYSGVLPDAARCKAVYDEETDAASVGCGAAVHDVGSIPLHVPVVGCVAGEASGA